jgi:hypothetical protein
MKLDSRSRSLIAGVILSLLSQISTASAAGAQFVNATVRAMTITLSGAPQALNVGQQQHSAFPSMAKLSDGSVRLVWRQGTDHYANRDGVIMGAISYDGAHSFTNAHVLQAGGDRRDPSVAVIYGAEWLTWFTGTNAAPAQGAWMMREWGGPFRFDGGLPYAATAAPLVQLPNGQLGGAFYGRKLGESIDTAFMAWSSDGSTWSTNRIANTIGAGIANNEPFLVVDGTNTLFFYRYGGNGIALRTSWNSGATGSWDNPRQILSDATGRPSTFRTGAGSLVMVYRQASTGAARLAYSVDHGATWTDGGVILPSVGGLGMTYATFVEPEPGKIRGVVGREGPNGATSQLYGFDLVES